MEELVKALTKKRLNALVWEILQGNTVRLVSANARRPHATMEEHVKMSMMERSSAIAGLGTKELTAKQL